MRLKIVLRSFTKLFRFDLTISMGFYQQWYGRSRMTLYSYSHSAWSCEKTNIVIVNFSQKTTLRQSNIGHILMSKEIIIRLFVKNLIAVYNKYVKFNNLSKQNSNESAS